MIETTLKAILWMNATLDRVDLLIVCEEKYEWGSSNR